MTWTYAITTGRMTHPDGGNFLGYSGAGHTLREGRDNPAMQAVVKKGPIPVGVYDIGAPHASPHTGPYTMDRPTPTGATCSASTATTPRMTPAKAASSCRPTPATPSGPMATMS